uniref:Uncharacterized protein n=1 Tax=Panagrolaimus sp. PS1159 TaxID=55785 RepID=A0AC35ERR8_9BILA
MTISQNTTILQQTSTSSATSSTNNLTTSQYDNTFDNNMPIRFWYSVEHILALYQYQPLFDILMSSLDSTKSYDISFTSIIQHLPIDFRHIARP